MGTIVGVDKETWDSNIAGQATAVAAIEALTAASLEKTNLSRLTSIIDLEAKFNTVLSSLQTYTTTNTAKMKAVGDTIVQEDASLSEQITENTHTIRFK
ncbi:hypothetical protein [Streptococcus loxodontisalivarius]|uniref:Type VII secretion effector n=1 Tax=Streptococcus loxodontisalivarius TaxID=1349415 RepID=A0ABS2PT74_9STRE|nr:hypothetical protein [Streptococcus loxodontisalivarius]MBM7643133.1 hypothetical protein [Streptococcus loxodontisalivarius]